MEVATAVRGPLITAWSVVSPFGMDDSAFGNGLRSGAAAATELDPGQWKVPFDSACLVEGFSNREVLGRKGTRSMDRVTGLAVAAVGSFAPGRRGRTHLGRRPGRGPGAGHQHRQRPEHHGLHP